MSPIRAIVVLESCGDQTHLSCVYVLLSDLHYGDTAADGLFHDQQRFLSNDGYHDPCYTHFF